MYFLDIQYCIGTWYPDINYSESNAYLEGFVMAFDLQIAELAAVKEIFEAAVKKDLEGTYLENRFLIRDRGRL